MKENILAVLRAYPQIYLACHVEHRTRQSSANGLTSRDATFLAHIEPEGSSPSALARHMGIAKSTLSASLKRLEEGGYLTLTTAKNDARRKCVMLTDAGSEIVISMSVLDAERVSLLLESMSTEHRDQAVQGLTLLAQAAKVIQRREE